MASTRIEVYKDNIGEWRWKLIHENGNIMADSAEGYETKQGVFKALDSVREYMASPEVASIEIL